MKSKDEIIKGLERCAGCVNESCDTCPYHDDGQRIIGAGRIECAENLLNDIKTSINQTRWIPVMERLPEPNKEVLVVGKDGEVAIAVYNDKLNYWLNYWANYQVRNVTHWMPLPEPPKEEEEE